MKKQKKLKKVRNPRWKNIPKGNIKKFWIRFYFESWPKFIWKQRYKTEKAMQEALKSLKTKQYILACTSENNDCDNCLLKCYQ